MGIDQDHGAKLPYIPETLNIKMPRRLVVWSESVGNPKFVVEFCRQTIDSKNYKNLILSTLHKNLDNFSSEGLGDISTKKIVVITAEWNEEVTFAMRDGAVAFLREYGATDQSLLVKQVPGSFELVFAATHELEVGNADGVIVIGCVIQGETPHFTFISQAVANSIAELNFRFGKPVVFGVLTTLNQEQALDRSGGKHGNKGIEAAATLIKMLRYS